MKIRMISVLVAERIDIHFVRGSKSRMYHREDDRAIRKLSRIVAKMTWNEKMQVYPSELFVGWHAHRRA